jgi:TetR/AcrR family transcriptional repressor of nem operon
MRSNFSKETRRAREKQRSRKKILDVAATRLRQEGLLGAAIAPVMKQAGLTHGAFYVHFKDKDDLSREAFIHALDENRRRWVGSPKPESWQQRLVRLAKRYLTVRHRGDLGDSCALASLTTDAARSDIRFKEVYQQELLNSLSAVAEKNFDSASLGGKDDKRLEDAIAFLSLCIGGLSLSRAVADQTLSKRILEICTDRVARIVKDPE